MQLNILPCRTIIFLLHIPGGLEEYLVHLPSTCQVSVEPGSWPSSNRPSCRFSSLVYTQQLQMSSTVQANEVRPCYSGAVEQLTIHHSLHQKWPHVDWKSIYTSRPGEQGACMLARAVLPSFRQGSHGCKLDSLKQMPAEPFGQTAQQQKGTCQAS